jgi:hypothetical protein
MDAERLEKCQRVIHLLEEHFLDPQNTVRKDLIDYREVDNAYNR